MANIKVELLIILDLKKELCDDHNKIFFDNFIEFVKDKIMLSHARHKNLNIIYYDLSIYLSCDDFCLPEEIAAIIHPIRNELINYLNQYPECIDEITFNPIITISGTDLELN